MSKEFVGATFVKVDVDKNQEASTRCKVRCMPTFQIYNDGKKVGQMEGADEQGLRKLIQKHIDGDKVTKVSDPLETSTAASCCVVS